MSEPVVPGPGAADFPADTCVIGQTYVRPFAGPINPGTSSLAPLHHQLSRRVDQTLCITWAGWRWGVQDLPGVRVGDLMNCQPDAEGTSLYVQAGHEGQQGIWASRLELAHSHLRTCPPGGMPGRSGSAPTSQTQETPAAPLSQHAAQPPQTPPAANPQAHKRRRRRGTAGAAPAAAANPTVVVLALPAFARPNKPGSGKSQNSWVISIKVVAQ